MKKPENTDWVIHHITPTAAPAAAVGVYTGNGQRHTVQHSLEWAPQFTIVKKMEYDIHWYSETKKDGLWTCDQAESYNVNKEEDNYIELNTFPGRGRDYWWFSLLNQVISEWPWSFSAQTQPPTDMSKEVAAVYQQWDSDAHNAGSLTRAELKAKLEELRVVRTELLIAPDEPLSKGAAHLISRLEETITNLAAAVPDEDQRIIFWFDN